jgi:Leucine-rich repeat (LRR) protein
MVGRAGNRELTLDIIWHDNTSDTLCFSVQGQAYCHWLKSDINQLKNLVELGASANELSAAFPDRGWYAIMRKITQLSSQNIVYVDRARMIKLNNEHKEALLTDKPNSMSQAKKGTRWKSHELEQIRNFAAHGTTQIEVVRAFPNRTWLAIQRQFRKMGYGPTVIAHRSYIDQSETYSDYCRRIGKLENSQRLTLDNVSYSPTLSRVSRSEGSTKRLTFDLAKLLIKHDLAF